MDDSNDVAARLAEMRLSREPVDLPITQRPADEAAAYALQAKVNARLARELGPVVGHKIGCTTAVMRAFLGIDNAAAGEIFATTVAQGEARLSARDFRRLGIECEIAVEIGPTIAPKSWSGTAADAVVAVMAAAEIVDDRYADFAALGPPSLIADNFFNAGCVLGPRRTDWRDLDLPALVGRTVIDGQPRGTGTGVAVMGHPFNALDWLIRRRLADGRTIAAGTVVLLGSLVETRWLAAGSDAVVSVEGLGSVAVHVD